MYYVCIEVALGGNAHGIGRSNWAKGRDLTGLRVQYPNSAASSIPRHSRWVVLVHIVRFQAQLYSGQLRVTYTIMKGGVVSHRAQKYKLWACSLAKQPQKFLICISLR